MCLIPTPKLESHESNHFKIRCTKRNHNNWMTFVLEWMNKNVHLRSKSSNNSASVVGCMGACLHTYAIPCTSPYIHSGDLLLLDKSFFTSKRPIAKTPKKKKSYKRREIMANKTKTNTNATHHNRLCVILSVRMIQWWWWLG